MSRQYRRTRSSPTESSHRILSPLDPLQGRGVAYFYVGGGPNDGDPESVDIREGEVPAQVVADYLSRRLRDGKASPEARGYVLVHFTDYKGTPTSYTTPIKVQKRK